jgi:CspA family cold shock protein
MAAIRFTTVTRYLTARLAGPLAISNRSERRRRHVASGPPLPGKRSSMIEGTVKFFNTTKGYGFIQPTNGSKDAFVHISAVERAGLTTLAEGQKVSYELETGRDGKQSATKLQLL